MLAEEGINQTYVCPEWQWGPDERQRQEEIREKGMVPHVIGIIITVLICMCIAYHVFKAVRLWSNYDKLKVNIKGSSCVPILFFM